MNPGSVGAGAAEGGGRCRNRAVAWQVCGGDGRVSVVGNGAEPWGNASSGSRITGAMAHATGAQQRNQRCGVAQRGVNAATAMRVVTTPGNVCNQSRNQCVVGQRGITVCNNKYVSKCTVINNVRSIRNHRGR